MPIQQHHIEEFKVIYKRRYNAELSNDEAWEMVTRLLQLFRLLLEQPLTKKKNPDLDSHRTHD